MLTWPRNWRRWVRVRCDKYVILCCNCQARASLLSKQAKELQKKKKAAAADKVIAVENRGKREILKAESG